MGTAMELDEMSRGCIVDIVAGTDTLLSCTVGIGNIIELLRVPPLTGGEGLEERNATVLSGACCETCA